MIIYDIVNIQIRYIAMKYITILIGLRFVLDNHLIIIKKKAIGNN